MCVRECESVNLCSCVRTCVCEYLSACAGVYGGVELWWCWKGGGGGDGGMRQCLGNTM